MFILRPPPDFRPVILHSILPADVTSLRVGDRRKNCAIKDRSSMQCLAVLALRRPTPVVPGAHPLNAT
jgi:hypothetical protein